MPQEISGKREKGLLAGNVQAWTSSPLCGLSWRGKLCCWCYLPINSWCQQALFFAISSQAVWGGQNLGVLTSALKNKCCHQCSCDGIVWARCRNPSKLRPFCNLKWDWRAVRTENRTEWVLMSVKRTHYWDKFTLTGPMSLSISFPDKEKQLSCQSLGFN